MVFKNFIFRSLFSFLFILIYLLIAFINFHFVFYLILLVYLLIFFEIYNHFKSYKLIPTIYILVSLFFFLNLDFNQINFINFNLFILIVVSFDVFSYLCGKLVGVNKLIKISPNKTIEGLLGGIAFSYIFTFLFSNYMKLNIDLKLIFFTSSIIISAFFGDILESYFKRKNNLKNSSEIIPGHGGLFDRFDSFLFAIIIYSVFINLKL